MNKVAYFEFVFEVRSSKNSKTRQKGRVNVL